MVGPGEGAAGRKFGGEGLGPLAGPRIDDAGAARPGLDQLQHPIAPAALALGCEGQFRSGEAVDEFGRVHQAELGADVLAGAGVGGGCHRHPRHAREQLGKAAQHPVVWPEIVAPLADAVRLVDGDQRQWPPLQPLQGGAGHQPLGGQIENVQRPGLDLPPGLVPLGLVDVGIQPGGGDPRLLQRLHLVAHQRDQRRDHQPEPGPEHRRDLVADALAAAGRQHRQRVTPGQRLGNHLTLKPTEIGMAEHTAQDIAG